MHTLLSLAIPIVQISSAVLLGAVQMSPLCVSDGVRA